MTTRTSAVRLALLIGAVGSSSGFVTPSIANTVLTRPISAQSVLGSTRRADIVIPSDEDETRASPLISARTARITAPVASVLAYLLPNPAVAYAGDGFQTSLLKYFPGSLTNSAITLRVASALRDRDYRQYNTLLGSSLCSDEINDAPYSLVSSLQSKFSNSKDGGVFNLGGLGGLPFVGKSGFGAFVSHCPDNGKVFILFGPHVGISAQGVVGKVERIGKAADSTSCGAAVGAYKAIKAGAAGGGQSTGTMDFQEEYIIEKLKDRLGGLAAKEAQGGDEAITFVTIQMYYLVLELLRSELEGSLTKAGFWDKVSEVTVLGGIVVNRGHGSGLEGGDDFFQPLMFKSINDKGEVDLYANTFGDLARPRTTYTFDDSLKKFFPGSLSNSAMLSRVESTLGKRDYKDSNTLLGSSLCSDEINDAPYSLISSLQSKYTNSKDGGIFNLGGLGGLPFVGKSGMGAFVSHCPDQGKVFILFGPHVGVSDEGIVGKVERVGKSAPSTSCGAAVGAYKAIKAAGGNVKAAVAADGDFQEEYIIEKLAPRLGALAAKSANGDDNTIAFVTKQMYDIIYDLLRNQLDGATSKEGFWEKIDEVTLLGGVVINRGHGSGLVGGDDFFQPYMFKSIKARGEVDLFGEAFGDLPRRA